MFKRPLRPAALAAVALAAGLVPLASAAPVTLTGVDDFAVSPISRSFFGGTGRTTITRTGPAAAGRFQVNGDENGGSGNTFGIYTVFDVPAAALGGANATAVNGLTATLNPATNANSGSGGVQDAGDLSFYFTTDTTPIESLNFVTAAGPPFVTPTGFGDQFADLTLLSSAFEATGVRPITRALDVGGVESALLAAINAGGNVRLLVASQTPGSVFQFGTGNPPSSTTLPFSGLAPTLTFDVTSVPEPAGLALLAVAGLLLARRRA